MLPLPAVEIEIAGSAVLIGAMVLLALRPTLGLAAVIVAFFALFHGYAHGTQMPNAANPLAYAIGFVIGTGLLHLVGIALGLVTRMPRDALAVRAAGGAIALAGL